MIKESISEILADIGETQTLLATHCITSDGELDPLFLHDTIEANLNNLLLSVAYFRREILEAFFKPVTNETMTDMQRLVLYRFLANRNLTAKDVTIGSDFSLPDGYILVVLKRDGFTIGISPEGRISS